MPINFPDSPLLNDTYTEGGRTWVWNGSVWKSQGTTAGPTGPAGANGTFIQASTTPPTSGDGNNGDLWIVYS